MPLFLFNLTLFVSSDAESQIKSLEKRVEKAEQELKNFNTRKQGKKVYSSENELSIICKNILKKNKVENIVQYNIKTQTTEKHIRAYKNKPARSETNTTFTVDVTIDKDTLENSKKKAGWRVYATNSPDEKFTLSGCVKIYRKEYIIEHCFKHLKCKPLHLLPLYLHRDDRIKGLINLLTLALSAIRIIEYKIHSGLNESNKKLKGLYPGNPQRATQTPSAQLVLKNFNEKYHTTVTPSVQNEDNIEASTTDNEQPEIKQTNKVTEQLEKAFTVQENTKQIDIQPTNSNTTKTTTSEKNIEQIDIQPTNSNTTQKQVDNKISQVLITPLTMLQVIILKLLDLSPTIYTDLEN